ncbi:hypothetical protein TrLO_g12623 [Triparma laevis f. longispina]|uniref:Uncharacterized protein n=1 Tax=Triparma laevis f. longispina TaxID=1714387 RepID=A0A9W7B0W9_9STRA|nr:hypothetical protein TrLO_g12623 [Triparma laevis f. longispina]
MTGVLSIIRPGTYSQLSYGLSLSIFFTVLLAALSPYNEARDNRIAVLSSALLILLFLMSSFKILDLRRKSVIPPPPSSPPPS